MRFRERGGTPLHAGYQATFNSNLDQTIKAPQFDHKYLKPLSKGQSTAAEYILGCVYLSVAAAIGFALTSCHQNNFHYKSSTHSYTSGITKFYLYNNNRPLTYLQVFQLLSTSVEFCSFFSTVFTKCPLIKGPTIYFELRPFAKGHETDPFEMVAISNNRTLNWKGDFDPFKNKITQHSPTQKLAFSFTNTRNDSMLIVPVGTDNNRNQEKYSNLLPFLKKGVDAEIRDFWRECGRVGVYRIKHMRDGKKMFLSSTNLVIDWLHLRFDSIPRFYQYAEYKRIA